MEGIYIYRTLGSETQLVVAFDEQKKPTFQPDFQGLANFFDAFGIEFKGSVVRLPKSEREYDLFYSAMADLIANKHEYRNYFFWSAIPLASSEGKEGRRGSIQRS